MRTIVIDPVTRIEGHAKITIHLDDEGQVAEHGVPRHAGARLREVHRRPALLRDAVDHRAHLRHLPDQPPARLGQGLRRHHERAHPADGGEAAGAAALRPDHAVARAELLPSLLAGHAARLRLRPGAAQRHRRDRGPPGARQGRHRAAQVRPAGDREPGQGTHPSVLDRSRRRQRAARPCGARPHPRRPAGGQGDRAAHARVLQGRRRPVRATRSPISAMRRTHVRRAWSTPSGNLQLYDGGVRFVDAAGKIVVDQMAPQDYQQFIGEATIPNSYLKAPYFKPLGFPNGIYRVGPLARLNVADALRHAAGRRRIRRIPPTLRQGGRRARSISTTPG